MLRGFRRSAAVVETQEREIEVVTGKIEIVRIAAEKSRVILHGKDQADIGDIFGNCKACIRRPEKTK